MTEPANDISLEALLKISKPEKRDVELLTKAYHFSKQAHDGQKRFSGEPYFNHAFATAYKLAELGMDTETIAAGLLHDTIEDGEATEEILKKEFGDEIAFLVEGVTKLGKLRYQGIERHTESLRKLFFAVAKDIRVLIIKLADRFHNVQTLEHVRKEKQKRIALETLEIYAPFANRLGMGELKGTLEDAAFPFAYPEPYRDITEQLRDRKNIKQKHLEKVNRTLQKELAGHGIVDFKTDYRIKHTYSTYQKLLKKEKDIEKIYDIAALRIIVGSVEECYKTLGIIHSLWRPLPGRIKDYIAFPKPNGYQSIHTTIFTGDGDIVEIQIRTEVMHQEAEYGIAAHFAYKEERASPNSNALNKRLRWVKQLSEWQKQVHESKEFLENLRMDFFEHRVFVFTPQGDVIDLPENASPIDFAYAIHSDIGNHASGAKVNGKFTSLDTPLKNGDIVEIITKKSSMPNQKWLQYVKTTLARKQIRSALGKNAS
ncbi:MAG: bifunctional (p)ppGpp synthetase/guanosine-3',5'-bis(diphosphate) 3'-pyrophosphohydrolase [Candidatus Lloydbacteria bacterium]|nr:bifunctional (p)ppGpp synthetase/guanosine-3',5'-bis(diphosphate) 3'-pyrophosphohydrolase [Candidatus Lloydbacteria bacterium]